MTCPCRNEESSFVSVEGGQEMPRPCWLSPFLDIFHVVDVLALVMRFLLVWSHDACVSKHGKNKKLVCAEKIPARRAEEMVCPTRLRPVARDFCFHGFFFCEAKVAP